MTKKRRIFVLIAVAAATVVFGVYFLFFKENSNYVLAAKELPEAIKNAEETFGTLTWQEFRDEREIETRDDTLAWENFGKTMPTTSYFYSTEPGSTIHKTRFLTNRKWFMGFNDQIADLAIQHVYDPTYEQWSSKTQLSLLGIESRLNEGLIGAADAGDHEAILEITKAFWNHFDKEMIEADWMFHLMQRTKKSLFEDSLLIAAVRNRNKPGVMQAVKIAASMTPDDMLIADAFSGDIRTGALQINELRNLPVNKIDDWLDELLLTQQRIEIMYPMKSPSLQEEVGRDVRHTFDRFSRTFRGIGSHAADALEARYWQSVVEFHELLVDAEQHPAETIKELEMFKRRLMERKDASYELSQMLLSFSVRLFSSTLESQKYMIIGQITRRAAFELVLRYPEYTSLPETLPQDISFDDPFGDGDVIYRKTDSGFVIYSRGLNGVDDGYKPDSLDVLREFDVNYVSFGDDDGIVVCYDPIIP